MKAYRALCLLLILILPKTGFAQDVSSFDASAAIEAQKSLPENRTRTKENVSIL